MLTSMRITGFRDLSALSMEGLTRVNLLVGENNAGKTLVLEAAEVLLGSGLLPLSLIRGPLRRGENVPPSPGEERGEEAYESEPGVREDICLHRIEKGAPVSIWYSADELLNSAQRQVEVR